MRILVFVLGLLGVLGCAVLGGALYYALFVDPRSTLDSRMTVIRQAAKLGLPNLRAGIEADHEAVLREWRTFLMLWPAAGLALVGSILAFRRRGFSAAALLLAAVVGPTFFFPKTIIFTGILILAGVLALLIRPARPKLAPVYTPSEEPVEEVAEEEPAE